MFSTNPYRRFEFCLKDLIKTGLILVIHFPINISNSFDGVLIPSIQIHSLIKLNYSEYVFSFQLIKDFASMCETNSCSHFPRYLNRIPSSLRYLVITGHCLSTKNTFCCSRWNYSSHPVLFDECL